MKLTFLITAGPTREYLDPVRFFSNASSGKMGYALARAAKRLGNRVVLVSGPVGLEAPAGVEMVDVVSAREMFREVTQRAERADIIIGAAAVADYRPAKVSRQKIRKSTAALSVKLVPNPDIIKAIGRKKGKKVVVGFALESRDLLKSAKAKMEEKNLDMIVANAPAVIGSERASLWIIRRDGTMVPFKKLDKSEAAERIIDEAVRIWKTRAPGKAVS